MVKHLPTVPETRVNPWVRKISWGRKWQPTPVFLPVKSRGQRSLVGYSPCGHKESDTTEQFHFTSLHFNGDSWEKTEEITELLEWTLQNIAVYISSQSVRGVCVCVCVCVWRERDVRKEILMYYKELAFVIAGTRLASWQSTEKVSKRLWVL